MIRQIAQACCNSLDYLQLRLWECKHYFLQRLPSDGEMTAILKRMGISSFKQYVIAQRLGHFGQRNFLPTDQHTFIATLKKEYPQQVNIIIETANELLKGKFDILGGGSVDMRRSSQAHGWQLNWRKDPITKQQFPQLFNHWRWYQATQKNSRNADIKGPWEITRCQHLVTIGQAYWLTGDERYARYFANIIMDFIRKNPVGFGVHWACNMDVSLRIVGWLAALNFFQHSKTLTYLWWRRLLKSLVMHGRFMVANLEYGTFHGKLIVSNHGVANFFGLYWLALNFPHLDAACVWRGIAETGLQQQITRQILTDGGPYESSLSYHRFMLEMFLSAYALSQHAKLPLSENYKQRLLLGLQFLHSLRQPSSRVAQIGDADNARAHIFAQYQHWQTDSFDHLFVAAAKVFSLPAFSANIAKTNQVSECCWPTVDIDTKQFSSTNPQVYPTSGIAVLQSPQSHLTFANLGPGTDGVGNHKHCDQLSIEWCYQQQPVFVDAGNYTYTQDPAARNQHRSTTIHNTVLINDQEQHQFDPAVLFNLRQQGETSFVEKRHMNNMQGVHGRFTKDQQQHDRRILLLADDSMIVDDIFTGDNLSKRRWQLLLHPGLNADLGDNTVIITNDQHSFKLQTDNLSWQVENSWYAPGYGKRIPTLMLVAKLNDPSITKITWLVQPQVSNQLSITSASKLADQFWE